MIWRLLNSSYKRQALQQPFLDTRFSITNQMMLLVLR